MKHPHVLAVALAAALVSTSLAQTATWVRCEREGEASIGTGIGVVRSGGGRGERIGFAGAGVTGAVISSPSICAVALAGLAGVCLRRRRT